MEARAVKMVAIAARTKADYEVLRLTEAIEAWLRVDEVQLVENPADETGTVADEAGEQVTQESTGEASTREHDESVTGPGSVAS